MSIDRREARARIYQPALMQRLASVPERSNQRRTGVSICSCMAIASFDTDFRFVPDLRNDDIANSIVTEPVLAATVGKIVGI